MRIVEYIPLGILALVSLYTIVRLLSKAFYKSKFEEEERRQINALEEIIRKKAKEEEECQGKSQEGKDSKQD